MSTNRERAELILFDLMNRDEEVSNAMFGDEYVSYVDALADDGLLRPDLPKPIINDDDGNPEWHADEYTVDVDRGLVGLWTPDGTHWEQTPTEARLLADALYAAATAPRRWVPVGRTTDEWAALLNNTTPGPWEAREDHGGMNPFAGSERVFGSDSCGDVSGAEEDVRLAAAAPDAVAEVIRLRRAITSVRDKHLRLADEMRPGIAHTVTKRYADNLDRILNGEGINHD